MTAASIRKRPAEAGRWMGVCQPDTVIVGSADAELLGCHAGALDARGDLLKGDLAGVVR
jgi:hypothetical protein